MRGKQQEELEELIEGFYESEDPPTSQEAHELIKASYLLGRMSVYSENCWDVDNAVCEASLQLSYK